MRRGPCNLVTRDPNTPPICDLAIRNHRASQTLGPNHLVIGDPKCTRTLRSTHLDPKAAWIHPFAYWHVWDLAIRDPGAQEVWDSTIWPMGDPNALGSTHLAHWGSQHSVTLGSTHLVTGDPSTL